MASGLQGRGTVAALGVLAAAVVAALLGVLVWRPGEAPAPAPSGTPSPAPVPQAGAPAPQAGASAPAAAPSAPVLAVPETPAPASPPQNQAAAPQVPAPQPVGSQAPGSQPQTSPAPAPQPTAPGQAGAPAAPSPGPATPSAPPSPSPPAQSATAPPAPPAAPAADAAKEAVAPTFDVVRVEPTGDSVIAGRGASGATVEMLRDGQVHARGVADQSGLFALIPPALPPGSHQIALQTIAPDGTRQRSKETVTVVISEERRARPLVALTAPDKPTVILSNPEPPEQRTAQPERPPATPQAPQPQQQASLPPQPAPPAPPRPPVKIALVEAEDGGRLFVSGEAAAGATIRLYLNDTLIAPGGVGGDGKVSFTIGRGVRPGDYRVRLDDVDPVNGSVKSRAEVVFNVPPVISVPLPPEPTPLTGGTAVASAPASTPAAPPSAAVAPARPAASPPAAPAPAASAPAQVAAVPPPPMMPAPQQQAQQAAPQPGASAPASTPVPGGAPVADFAPAPASPAPTRAPGPTSPGQQVAAAAPPPNLQIGTIVVPEINTALVSRGDNLWRISQRIYGRGVRYTVIYGANQPQIRNPNLIYPGQVFVLPGEQEPKSR